MQTNYKGTVFFDLDGTLLNNQSEVDDSVAEAVRQLKANNYLPVICTGRSPIEIKAATSTTGIDSYITLNGAFVQSENKTIYQNNLKPELIEDIIELAHDLGDTVSMHTAYSTYLSENNSHVTEFFKHLHIDLPEIDRNFYKKDDVEMLVILSNGTADRYQEKYDELTFYKTGHFSIDTINNGISKMSGIKHLLKELKLEDKPTYAFGDGTNDIPMIKFADYSVAMANGIDDVKDIATYTTTENVNGGIVNGLKHFNLI